MKALSESADRAWEMMRKELRQVLRDPRLRMVIFASPVIQLLLLGYVASTDVRAVPTFVVDHDRTRISRDLVEALTASGYFRVVGGSERPADLARALDRGDAILGLQIPPRFAEDLHQGRAQVQALFDGSNSNTALVAQGYAERIVQGFGARLAASGPGAVDLRARAWFNPDLARRNYNVPGVIGTILLFVCLLLTAFAVVREREAGTLEQLMVSPLTKAELIAGKTLPFLFLGLVDLAVVMAVSLLWFQVPFRGNAALLVLASLLYILSGLGAGLLVSTVSSTQQEAFMASFLVFMPAVLLSGFVFPVSSMPLLFQWLTLLNPVRHYLVIVRGLFLKGTGLAVLWPQHLALLLIGAGLLAFAATRFKKTAE